MAITPYIRNVGFSPLKGHHNLVCAPMDYFSFLGRSGHMSGRVCFNAFMTAGIIFKKKESQI